MTFPRILWYYNSVLNSWMITSVTGMCEIYTYHTKRTHV